MLQKQRLVQLSLQTICTWKRSLDTAAAQDVSIPEGYLNLFHFSAVLDLLCITCTWPHTFLSCCLLVSGLLLVFFIYLLTALFYLHCLIGSRFLAYYPMCSSLSSVFYTNVYCIYACVLFIGIALIRISPLPYIVFLIYVDKYYSVQFILTWTEQADK